MQTIELADDDHDRVMLLARAWKVSAGEAIRRLLDEFASSPGSTAEPRDAPPDDGVRIFADYDGQHVEAIYHQRTKRVEITSGHLEGYTYRSPSGAAIAIVQSMNPNIQPNRNGWSFWFVAETGKTLNSIRKI